MNRQRKSLPKNLNAIAGGLSLVVITLYVADLGLQPSRIFKPTPTQAIDPLAAKTADRIGTGLVVERFDQNGKLSQRFSSLRAEYFNQPVTRDNNDTNGTLEDSFDESDLFFNDHAKPYNIVVKVSEPVIKVFEAGEAIAELDANAAITDARNHSTELIGGVRLIDTANDAMMLTEKLVLNTLSKQVLTREHVKIFSPNSSTTADGLQGNLTDQRWQLMANVKSVIQP